MSITSWFCPKPITSTSFKQNDVLKFHIHDEEHSVRVGEMPADMTLNKYLRKVAMTGTKNMCLEGGCGVCVVAVSYSDPITEKNVTVAVNSCLVPLYSCSGWKIHTVDGIGNTKSGFHPTQKAMVQFNGTQCGYCSPGMIMNMFALYENQENVTMKEVENAFGGNICRCTGYRPILTAFKSLASDVNVETLGSYADIEDIPICKRDRNCQLKCEKPCKPDPHVYAFQDCKWYKAYSINEIFDILKSSPDEAYMIVGGNTATGVYKRPKDIKIFIDVSCAKSLLGHSMDGNKLTVGANMTLTNAMNLFSKLSGEHLNFSYLKKLADHIDLIANVPVRNAGTLAGNLFTKHEHPDFPSDIFLIMETAGAILTLVNIDGKEVSKSPAEFLSFNMKNTIIKNIILPALDKSYKYESYKIMPRAQNAHALVNAGFLVQFDEKQLVKSIRIVYGSINPGFVHAQMTEGYLIGKNLFDDDTLQGALEKLDEEINPDYVLPDPTPKFRKELALALFYKFVLSIAPDDKVSPANKSGGTKFIRPVSTGTQDYETNKSLYPLTQPISKVEALDQCTGKAQYIMDMPDQPGQLFAAFVLAQAAPYSVITKIDTAEALKLPGVKAYFDKNDIPGENTFTPLESGKLFSKTEELFCSGVVKYYYQPVGIVVAVSQELAEEAAELVKISYTPGKTDPNFTIRDILANNAKDKIITEGKVEAKTKGSDVKHVIKGTFDISWQYHYQMETQCCVVIPVEGGLDMYPATQDMQFSQVSAAKLLNIPVNKVNVSVRRLGGAYGSKISRNGFVSCAAALAAYKLQKPVKFAMSLSSNMNVIGKRLPLSSDYEVGIDDEGVVQYLNTSLYSDLGSDGGNENACPMIMHDFASTYKSDVWNIDMFSTRTDNHTATWCRAPGTMESIGCCENIMQHVAVASNLDPIAMRLKNLHPNYPQVGKYLNDLVEWAEIKQRKSDIEKFNKENRWVKRGIAAVPLSYPVFLFGNWHSHVSIFQADGSVVVSHGGIEMGQGINTKVAQVCAYNLGIPLSQVRIQPGQVLVSPNNMTTGGSVTSENVCYATTKACDILKERMKPIKDKMTEPVEWKELVQKCYLEEVNLTASFMYHAKLPDVSPYQIFGATCVETEIDILTGTTQIKRVDIIEDTGDSLSPQVDIGQVEGSFVMGLGYWTCEQLVFNVEGKLLTNRTWTYKPPGAKDIPIDFRVKFPKDNPNKVGILNSKATGEPPMCMTIAVPLAIRDAVASARLDSDPDSEKWYPIDGPSTVENTFESSLNNFKHYKL